MSISDGSPGFGAADVAPLGAVGVCGAGRRGGIAGLRTVGAREGAGGSAEADASAEAVSTGAEDGRGGSALRMGEDVASGGADAAGAGAGLPPRSAAIATRATTTIPAATPPMRRAGLGGAAGRAFDTASGEGCELAFEIGSGDG